MIEISNFLLLMLLSCRFYSRTGVFLLLSDQIIYRRDSLRGHVSSSLAHILDTTNDSSNSILYALEQTF